MAPSTTRRSFFSRLTAGMAALGVGVSATPAQAAAPPFEPTRHSEDDWLDAVPGKHRVVLDSTSPLGAGQAIVYATNFLTASRLGYALQDQDSAIVLILRHEATPFAFTDAMWAKYGSVLGPRLKFMDPRSGKAPTVNVYMTTGYDDRLPNRNIALGALAGRGVHYAVCGLATRLFATGIATATGADLEATVKELSSNLIPNAHMMTAGVIAANRAQERGYTFLYVG